MTSEIVRNCADPKALCSDTDTSYQSLKTYLVLLSIFLNQTNMDTRIAAGREIVRKLGARTR